MSVFLRGRERRMTQKFLDDSEVGAGLQQVRCEGMSHRMRTYAAADSTLLCIFYDDSSYTSVGEFPPPAIDKHTRASAL